MNSRSFALLILLLLLKAAVVFWFVHSEIIGLGPDEAQYWTWSQHLDLGYYSKPPAIAWQIKLGTLLFGDTESGVRFASNVIGFLLPIAVYWLAQACSLPRENCFWAGVIMAFSPLGMLSSFLATTDGGMVLFWTVSCALCASALQRKTPLPYAILGLTILCGALFKWPIFLLWPLIFIVCPRAKLLLGAAISCIGLFPSIWWNAHHDWATFRHVFTTILGGHKAAETAVRGSGNFFEFWGAQFALLSPILFGLLLFGGWRCWRERRTLSLPLVFCALTTFLPLFAYAAAALFQKIQGNWCVFLYPTGAVLAAYQPRRWICAGTILSVILVVAAINLPYKISPFRHNLGWKELGKALDRAGYDPRRDFLFSDKYQITSLLSFYANGQKQAYFLNLLGTRKNQFAYWPGMWDAEHGRTGFFVVVEGGSHLQQALKEKEPFYAEELKKYFSEVDSPNLAALTSKGALIYKCENYNGLKPDEPDKW